MRSLIMASAALVSLGYAAPAATQDINEAIDDIEIEVLDLDREKHNRLTLPVLIDGQGPFDMVVDTGAESTIVTRALATRLGLTDLRPATLVGMASRREIEVAQVMEFTLGKSVFDIETVPVIDDGNVGSADGILGIDSLQGRRVLFDFEDRTISVTSGEDRGSRAGFEIVVKARKELGQLIITDARVNGIKTNVIVSTGAEGSVGNLALKNRLRGRQVGSAQMTDVNGVEESSELTLVRDLEIGRGRISNFPIAFVDSPTFEALGIGDEPAMVLGIGELRLFDRVAIDFEDNRVMFDLPRGPRWIETVQASRLNP
ncbi:MAG TPA: aspartyl protease family protein [Sphingomonadaceae bacterium]|nr:aspartyl protease family protein [Sphingomonadaceae bacterium]